MQHDRRRPTDATPPHTPGELEKAFRRGLRAGLRASRLLDQPALLGVLAPSPPGPPVLPGAKLLPPYERAMQAEAVLVAAIERIGGPAAEALRILAGLTDGALGLSLRDRRIRAGRVLSSGKRQINGATFAKNYESVLVRDLVVEVWRAVEAKSSE